MAGEFPGINAVERVEDKLCPFSLSFVHKDDHGVKNNGAQNRSRA